MLDGWVSPWWQAMCLPRKWNICGTHINALSCWHTFALENIGNRYLIGGNPTRDDAMSLLLFVRGGWKAGLRIMRGPNHRAMMMRRMYQRVRKMEWAELDMACREFVETCMRSPRRWSPKDKTPGNASVPPQVHLVRVLVADYHMTEEQAWDTPYAYARMLYDAHAESNGDTSICSIHAEAVADELESKNIDPETGKVRGSNDGGDSTT